MRLTESDSLPPPDRPIFLNTDFSGIEARARANLAVGTAAHTAIQRAIEVPIRIEPYLVHDERRISVDAVQDILRHTSQVVWQFPSGLVTTTPPDPDAASVGTINVGIDPGLDSWATVYMPERPAEPRSLYEQQIMGEFHLGGDFMHGDTHEPTEDRRVGYRVGRRGGMTMASAAAMLQGFSERLPDEYRMTLDYIRSETGRTIEEPGSFFQRELAGFSKIKPEKPFDDALRPSRRAIIAAGGMDLSEGALVIGEDVG